MYIYIYNEIYFLNLLNIELEYFGSLLKAVGILVALIFGSWGILVLLTKRDESLSLSPYQSVVRMDTSDTDNNSGITKRLE